jgi:hypothetical protein
MAEQLRKVDHSALRVNQAVIILLLAAGFVLDSWWFAAATALFMLLGTAVGRPGFFFLYTGILKPLRIVRPHVLADNPEPHRFAQGFGGVVAAGSAALLATGFAVGGWALSWLVIALAALNLFAGFCVGCAVYYWLQRIGLPGFTREPPSGIVPGMRPRA